MPLLSSVVLLLAAAPPPPVVAAPVIVAPPVVQRPGYRAAAEYRERMERQRQERETMQERQRRSRATMAVEVSGGGQSLWSGTLRVGYPTGASVERSLTQAMPVDCGADENGSYRAGRNSFRLRLDNPQFPDKQVRMGFSISWQRPAETCADAQFTRGIELSGSVQLVDGQSVTVTGDGGLVAKFRLLKREIVTSDGDRAPPITVVE
jgi:hypothetical protein